MMTNHVTTALDGTLARLARVLEAAVMDTDTQKGSALYEALAPLWACLEKQIEAAKAARLLTGELGSVSRREQNLRTGRHAIRVLDALYGPKNIAEAPRG